MACVHFTTLPPPRPPARAMHSQAGLSGTPPAKPLPMAMLALAGAGRRWPRREGEGARAAPRGPVDSRRGGLRRRQVPRAGTSPALPVLALPCMGRVLGARRRYAARRERRGHAARVLVPAHAHCASHCASAAGGRQQAAAQLAPRAPCRATQVPRRRARPRPPRTATPSTLPVPAYLCSLPRGPAGRSGTVRCPQLATVRVVYAACGRVWRHH